MPDTSLMWRAALSLLLIAYIPGAVAYRLPLGTRSLRGARPFEERLFWAVLLSVAFSSLAALALAAAGVYRLDRLLWIVGGSSALMVLAARGGLAWRHEAPRPTWTALLPVLLIGLGAALFFHVRPAEWIVGGRDPGIYMNEGIQISQRGSLVVTDPTVASVPPRFRGLFHPPRDAWGYDSVRFVGFFVLDPAAGTVVGQFPHLYPAWIAIGYDIAGISGARYVIGAWALLGVLAVYFAGVWHVGRWAALAGAGLLCLHVMQVWFARYPNAELVMQPLVFGGLLAFARAQVDDDRFFAPVAAVALGLAIFAHLTAIVIAGAVAGAAVLGRAAGQRTPWAFLVPLGAMVALYGLYLGTVLIPYAGQPVGFIRNLTPGAMTLLIAGGAAALAVAWAVGRGAIGDRVQRWCPPVTLALIGAATAYALLLREAGGRLAPHDADALRTFTTFYLSPLGLAATLCGLLLVAWLGFWRNLGFLFSLIGFASVFFYKARIVPEHFWWSRRFVAIVLPACLLLVGAAAFTRVRDARAPAWSRGRTAQTVRYALGLALVVTLGYGYLDRTRPILRHVEYAGVIPQLEQLASDIGENDLVLIESRAASDLHVLGPPLEFIYARRALTFDRATPNKPRLASFLEWARTRYDRVLFLAGGGMDVMMRGTRIEPLGDVRFRVPEYEAALNAYPGTVRGRDFDFGLYEFLPGEAPRAGFDLDVGDRDAPYVRRFHAPERRESGVTFRWTRDESHVAIVGATGQDSELVLHLGTGGRPTNTRGVTVAVHLNDRTLGNVSVADGIQPYRLPIPPDLAAEMAASRDAARLRLETTTWNPARSLGTTDDRDLGVMVDRIEVH